MVYNLKRDFWKILIINLTYRKEDGIMTQDRKSLSAAEERDVWIKTGGKCALCKSELILTELNEKTNVGDKAHIIGHGTEGPRRHQMKYYNLTEEEVDRPQNLIVLCKSCHKKVDTHPESYPAEYLFKKKNDHEKWVISRLSIENKAIAVVHKTMGEPLDHINLANQAELFMIDAVVYQKKNGKLFNQNMGTNEKFKPGDYCGY